MTSRYQASNQFLERAEKSIPLGSQTFSKSKIAYPEQVSPLFIEKGEGCQVWDIDGNQYTDFVSGLLSVSLGYCDEDIDNAVIKQLQLGVTFSLPHRLETEVAELLTEHIPCAEMVRFGKNGSDATSAAIRLARAYTSREHVAVCGYHGWQDWYIGSTSRDLGVPEATKGLTHQFKFNDINSLLTLLKKNKYAAVILEPMNIEFPKGNFLEDVKSACKEHGAVLIFDETITGFRYSLGGAQELFNVTPDLATFGKGMANGYPISAVVGRQDIMMLMKDIFFSGTFAGETLSLAAAKATIEKIANEKVLDHILQIGNKLVAGLEQLIIENNWQSWLSIAGHPSWSFLIIKARGGYSEIELRSLFLQEVAEHGVLLNGGHNLNFSHTTDDIDYLLSTYQKVLSMIDDTITNKSFNSAFNGKLLEPIFKVR